MIAVLKLIRGNTMNITQTQTWLDSFLPLERLEEISLESGYHYVNDSVYGGTERVLEVFYSPDEHDVQIFNMPRETH